MKDEFKGDFDNDVNKFYASLGEEEGEFQSKCTGYCLIYAPYCITFIETDDEQFLNYVLQTINDNLGKNTHDAAWVLFNTEEVPQRYYHDWYVKSF